MLTTSIFPQSFKNSKIIPLYKKDDHSLLTNYRPISLLPTISRVFERIIYDQMYAYSLIVYLNESNLLAEEQFGFRKYHFTKYAWLMPLANQYLLYWFCVMCKPRLKCSLGSLARLSTLS